MDGNVVTVKHGPNGTPLEYVFHDHPYMSGSTPVLRMADVICSLPWNQQIPLVAFMGDLLESERERSSALARLNSVLEDLRLIVVSLRHDLESTKREKQALIEKYEKKI
jgi:predicted MPP superfamily phosphohydrolase